MTLIPSSPRLQHSHRIPDLFAETPTPPHPHQGQMDVRCHAHTYPGTSRDACSLLLCLCISQWNLPPNLDMKSMYTHMSPIPAMAQTGFHLGATVTPEGIVAVVVAVAAAAA